MLDQLFNIVKRFGQRSVVQNPEVPDQYNQDVMADATKTIAGGFQNVLAGGGFGSILDLFRKGRRNSQSSGTGGIGNLLKNPMVSMMVGYFISKLVGKYKMSPAAASNVANDLIPNSVSNLVQQTNDPENQQATLDRLVNSLAGSGVETTQVQGEDGPLQQLLDKDEDPELEEEPRNGGFNLRSIINNLAQKVQYNFRDQQEAGGHGIKDLIKGFTTN